jgi:hypothetical protein
MSRNHYSAVQAHPVVTTASLHYNKTHRPQYFVLIDQPMILEKEGTYGRYGLYDHPLNLRLP